MRFRIHPINYILEWVLQTALYVVSTFYSVNFFLLIGPSNYSGVIGIGVTRIISETNQHVDFISFPVFTYSTFDLI